MPRARDPLDLLDPEDLRNALRRIADVLYPPDDPNQEWSMDTCDEIAKVLRVYGALPPTPGPRTVARVSAAKRSPRRPRRTR